MKLKLPTAEDNIFPFCLAHSLYSCALVSLPKVKYLQKAHIKEAHTTGSAFWEKPRS